MVADELATSIAAAHVRPGDRVLDPFCGSGRLLVAASQASERVGLDVNPLACLITRAKLGKACPEILGDLAASLSRDRPCRPSGPRQPFLDEEKWFHPTVARELSDLVAFLSGLELPSPEMRIVAAALSATVRETSFARQGGWKLHRKPVEDRAIVRQLPSVRLARRLRYCRDELRAGGVSGPSDVRVSDVRDLDASRSGRFDRVLTSPPYGDSRTTVQYGAASALCLSVVSRLVGSEVEHRPGRLIDAECLGGAWDATHEPFNPTAYWEGEAGSTQARSVGRFLHDYGRACDAIVDVLKPGGRAVIVVGRRSTGGHRVRLDDFTVEHLTRRGLALVSREEREMTSKRFPIRINRFARSKDPQRRLAGNVETMGSEIVLVLDAPSGRAASRTGHPISGASQATG